VKVKEPQASEWSRCERARLSSLICIWRRDLEQAKGLMASGCTAIAYETVTDAKGGLPCSPR